MPSRLERSNANRVIAGVCGGIAEYLAVDATLVRVVFVVLGFFGGIGLLAYIVLLILMPLPGRPAPFTSTTPPAAPADATAASTVAPVDPAIHAAEAERRRMAVGYLLIGLGVVFLLSNAGVFRFAQLQLLWPLVLIGIGALFLLLGRRHFDERLVVVVQEREELVILLLLDRIVLVIVALRAIYSEPQERFSERVDPIDNRFHAKLLRIDPAFFVDH